jgi:hypothetical protein
MIRNLLSSIITQVAQSVIPNARGDIQDNPIFTPIFKEYITLEPTHQEYQPNQLDIVSGFRGMFYVSVFTDKLSPLDPQLLNIHFRQNPIIAKHHLIPDTNTIIQKVKSNPFIIDDLPISALVKPVGNPVGNGIILAQFTNGIINEYTLSCIDDSTPNQELWELVDINGQVISNTLTTQPQYDPNQDINIISQDIPFVVGDKFQISALGLEFRANVIKFTDVTSERSKIETILVFEIKDTGYVLKRTVDPSFLPNEIYVYLNRPEEFNLGEHFSEHIIIVEPTTPIPDSPNVILLAQSKITIEKPIINGTFDIRNSLASFYTTDFLSTHPTDLGDNIDEFNNTPYIMVFLNGQMLEKGVQILYIDNTHFQFNGTVDANDVFTIFGK